MITHAENQPSNPGMSGGQNLPGGMQPAPEIKSKSLPYAWIITGVVIVLIAAAGWWLLQPKAQAVAAAPAGILATAPPPANPKPLNADGAPRSD